MINGRRWLCPIVCIAASIISLSTSAAEAAVRGYCTESNVLYRSGAELDASGRERCRLDLYYPADAPGFATVVWFHGGGLTGGSRSVPEALKGKGIAVAAAGYRLSPDVKAPVYIEDAAAAVA